MWGITIALGLLAPINFLKDALSRTMSAKAANPKITDFVASRLNSVFSATSGLKIAIASVIPSVRLPKPLVRS